MAMKVKNEIDYAALENQEAPVLTPRVAVEQLPKVKHIVRWLSKGVGTGGSVPSEEVERYLGEWLDKGYRLFSTHYLGDAPEGYGVLYILVLQ